MADRTAIEVDQFLSHPPARVWRALTDPDRLARWLMPNDFAPVVGHRFTLRTDPRPDFDGIVHCEVLAVEPERLLRAEGRGTRLLLHHEGFDPDDPLQRRALTIMGGGWRSHIMRALEAELADRE